MKSLLAAVAALGFVSGPAIAQQAAVTDGPVLRAVGKVISVGNTSLAIETQEHGHAVSFVITTTTVMPASVPVGSRVEVAYHAVGVSTQVADRVVLLDAPPPSASGAGEVKAPLVRARPL